MDTGQGTGRLRRRLPPCHHPRGTLAHPAAADIRSGPRQHRGSTLAARPAMRTAIRLRTIAKLGPANVARVAAYRLGLATGLGRVRRLKARTPHGPFFPTYDGPTRTWPARQTWRCEATY